MFLCLFQQQFFMKLKAGYIYVKYMLVTCNRLTCKHSINESRNLSIECQFLRKINF